MFCSKCGAEIAEDSLFCSKCGQKIGESNMETSAEHKKDNIYELVIHRKQEPEWNINLTIDGQKKYDIRPNCSVTIPMKRGKHIIAFSELFMNKVFEIDVNSYCRIDVEHTFLKVENLGNLSGGSSEDGITTMTKYKYNMLSVVGFVVSIISLFLNLTGLVGIVAIILSLMGYYQTNQKYENGKFLSFCGIIISVLSIIYAAYLLLDYT